MFAGSTKKTSQHFLVAILLELPIPVVEGADLQFLWMDVKSGWNFYGRMEKVGGRWKISYLASFEPPGDAVEVEGVVAPF